MRFIIKQTGVGTERIGQLTGFIKSPTTIIETPNTALITQGGSIVNLTAEVLAKVFSTPQLLWIPLSNSLHLEPGLKAQNEGVAKFAGLPEHFTCVTLHSMSESTPATFDHHKIPLWTKNGKQLITPDRYMDLVELFKPDMYMIVADGHTFLDSSKKRITKAINRSITFMNRCVERHKSSDILKQSSLIGVIVGTAEQKDCNAFIEQLLTHKEHLCGVTLQGITNGSDESLDAPTTCLNKIFHHIGEEIPNNLLRIVEGCWSPIVILGAIEHGWDLFDGSYPLKLTNAGFALRLNFDIDKKDDTPYFFNLNDTKYNEDFQPILESCECLACKKHTRAYIRHLLNTREMLASVLLSIHNLYHFDQFFSHVRRHIAENTFELFKHHITKQCYAHKLIIPNMVEPATNDAVATPKTKKKKKRMETGEVSSDNVDMTSNT